MELEIIPKQDIIPCFDLDAVVVRQIGYYTAETQDKEVAEVSYYELEWWLLILAQYSSKGEIFYSIMNVGKRIGQGYI